MLMLSRCEKGQLDPGPYAIRGTFPYVPFLCLALQLTPPSFLSQQPPNVLPATTFLTRFLSLLSSSSSCKSIFLSTLPSQTSFSVPDIHLTSSPTINFIQLALITIQRAPAVGTSGVQARGMDGGIGREWESLVGRYRRMSGVKGVLGDKEAQEVSVGRVLLPRSHIRGEDYADTLTAGSRADLDDCVPSCSSEGTARRGPPTEPHGLALRRRRRSTSTRIHWIALIHAHTHVFMTVLDVIAFIACYIAYKSKTLPSGCLVSSHHRGGCLRRPRSCCHSSCPCRPSSPPCGAC